MCGIVGFIDTSLPSKDFLTNSGSLMANALSHRGPDDNGIWVDTNYGISLAHRRLSILDLSKNASQPMISQSGRWIIVFNGEIYNHLEIRKIIDQKSNFKKSWKSTSDTETLLESIEIFGIGPTLKMCVGMFSFAIWDRKEKIIHLARDRFGEKPLYWGKINTKIDNKSIFIFSSELSAIWEFPEAIKCINKEACITFFNYGYIEPPKSVQKGINQLLPGEYISINFENINFNVKYPPRAKKWWNNFDEYNKAKNKIDEYNDNSELEKIIENSINLQSNADVTVGAFLSGGIDSTLVATLLQKNSTRKVKTFNVSFPDIKNHESIYDEGPYASEIAKRIGSDHLKISLLEKEAIEFVKNIGSFFSEPFADSSQIPTYLVCKEAKKNGLSVALSGDGGDELFGGYNRHLLIPKIHKIFGKLPKFFNEKFMYSFRNNELIKTLISEEKSQKLFSAIKSSSSPEEIYDVLTKICDQSIFDYDYKLRNKIYDYRYEEIKNISERIMMRDLNNYLPFDILVKMDRSSMANSIETRAPFLDHRVAQYAWGIPIKSKISRSGINTIGKLPLREILYKYHPKRLINRKKNGFSIPLKTWLKGPLKDWAYEMINPMEIKRSGFLNDKLVQKLWDDHISGRYDNTNKLWTIIMWQAWIKNWNII